MKCVIPKYSGFCFGVSLAVNAAYENTDGIAYMYGEIVHNPVVVNDLQAKGVRLVHSIHEIPSNEKARVLVRAHGVPESTISEISQRGLEVIDKTCPRVKKVHNIVLEASNKGLDIIVVGTQDHPEIAGIIGWAKTKTVLLHCLEQAKEIIPHTFFSKKGVCMVSQTTHNKKKYIEIYEYCSSIIPNIEFHNTICDATSKRQNEVRELAKISDAFIVVGGKTSSNVTKLYEIALEYCANTQYIESAGELDLAKLTDINTLIIVGGASTPNSSVEEVIDIIRSFCNGEQIPFEIEKC